MLRCIFEFFITTFSDPGFRAVGNSCAGSVFLMFPLFSIFKAVPLPSPIHQYVAIETRLLKLLTGIRGN